MDLNLSILCSENYPPPPLLPGGCFWEVPPKYWLPLPPKPPSPKVTTSRKSCLLMFDVVVVYRGLGPLGPFVIMIYKMCASDIIRFFIIFIIFILQFGQGINSCGWWSL